MVSSSRSGRRKQSFRPHKASKVSLQQELRLRLAPETVILLTLVFLVYANSLHNGFVWDDHEQLVMNPAVQPRAPLSPLLSSDVRFSHLGLGAQTHTYRPLQMASYWAISNLFGIAPSAFHWGSIFLAAAGVLGVFWVLNLLTERASLAFVASALFAVNPLHSEAVDWVAATPDLGCGLCLLIAFAAFMIVDPARGGGGGQAILGLAFVPAFAYRICSRATMEGDGTGLSRPACFLRANSRKHRAGTHGFCAEEERALLGDLRGLSRRASSCARNSRNRWPILEADSDPVRAHGCAFVCPVLAETPHAIFLECVLSVSADSIQFRL